MRPSRLTKIPQLVVIVVMLLFAGFPLYWMYNTATSTNEELFGSGQSLWLNLGRALALEDVFNGSVPLFAWMGNSAFVAVGTTVLSLALAVLAAYALSRFKFYGRGGLGLSLFVTQMLPEALLIVPLYSLFATLGLINNLSGLVFANTAFAMPVAVWIIKTAMDGIPFEIEESARIDGCPRFGVLTQVVLPLVAPSVAAASVVTFFQGWNEYLFATTFIHDQETWPASKGLASFIGQFSTPLPTVISAAILFSIPAVVFFLLVQRHIISGLTAGSVKG